MDGSFKSALADFQRLSWDRQVDTLQNVVNVLDDGDDEFVIHNMRQICIVLCTALESLRSMVVRAGISTLTVLFSRLGHCMDSEIEVLLSPIIKRASDCSNKFLRNEAISLLNVINSSISPLALCKTLLEYMLSKNDSVRALMMNHITSSLRKSSDKIVSNQNLVSRLITVLATLLGDKSADVRDGAKESLLIIKTSISKTKPTKLSSSTLSSVVSTAINLADGRGRNRHIRSAPPEARRPRSIARYSSPCTRRRESSLSRTGPDKPIDRFETPEETRPRCQTPSPIASERYRLGHTPAQLRQHSYDSYKDFFLNRETLTFNAESKIFRKSIEVAPGIRKDTARFEPQTQQESVSKHQKAGPKIYELSLLHSRMKLCSSQVESKKIRRPALLIAGRTANDAVYAATVSRPQNGFGRQTL